MARRCITCGGRPQETRAGECRQCKEERVERVMASIQEDAEPKGQTGLDDF